MERDRRACGRLRAGLGPLDVRLRRCTGDPALAGLHPVRDGLRGRRRLARPSSGDASNLAGVAYAAATLAVVDGLLGGTVLALSLVVGAFMFVASLHPYVEPLSYTPGASLGYATMFSVAAASATVPGTSGLAGETLAAAVSMVVGACIGYGADGVADRLAAE